VFKLISFEEVKSKGQRHNSLANQRLMFFASRVSIFFSWIFVNLGMSANQVTALFFVTGLIGALAPIFFSFETLIFSYILFRMHAVFDVCDGEVARFWQKFSLNGAYWDYMIHSLLFPLYCIAICTGLYFKFEDEMFLLLGMFLGLSQSLLLATKNTYFRALFVNNVEHEEVKGKGAAPEKAGFRFYLFFCFSLLAGFEGMFALVLCMSYFDEIHSLAYLVLIVFYIALFLCIALIKFYMLSKKGFYFKRS